jgi:formate/nitrite transporter FocA (FNT family)
MEYDQNTVKESTENLMEDLGEGIGYVRAFVEQEIESAKLTAAEKISIATSTMITGFILSLLAGVSLLFLSVALGLFLGRVLASMAFGFLIVGCLYLLLLLGVYIFRKRLITDNIVEAVIQFLFHDEDEEDSESE